ncbi:hypothetical protein J7337_007591 [Fusarium musae]|uniref:Uncharacterized protein n=1 Tax=Fusarium musae TaxID=1042133 RepID=A0A9P8IQH1_9HYPO|nr:hypothetical protein J7337_007591 [Fusarium musae]KAG9501890.1 hypothetical protein J7337_007591 [Fusarium musae]
MRPKASEKTNVAVKKPSKSVGEMLSEESVGKPDMTGQVTKTPGTESAPPRTKEVNGRRFTFRLFDSNGFMLPADMHWTDEDGSSEAWWEKKSLLRDWIYGRMSPEEFDTRFPYYSHAMPQEEQEPSGPKESDELCTQRYANYYGDGSGLPLRPGMGPMTDEQKQEISDIRSPHPPESDEDWTEEEFHRMAQDDTETMLLNEYYACLHGDDGETQLQPSKEPSKTEEGFVEDPMKEDNKEKPRYAQRNGDGSGLPLRPGMGPPLTEEEYLESWQKRKEQFESHWKLTDEEQKLLKKWRAKADNIFDMSDKEFNAEFPEYDDKSECFCTEVEVLSLMENCDEAHGRRREEMIRKSKESSKACPEDQL